VINLEIQKTKALLWNSKSKIVTCFIYPNVLTQSNTKYKHFARGSPIEAKKKKFKPIRVIDFFARIWCTLWTSEVISHCMLHCRGAARIFLRGGLKLWKQKLWKGKIACDKNSQESTYIVDKQLTVLTRKPRVLPTKLPSCFSDILSWRPENSTTLITWLSWVLFWSMIFFYGRKAYFSRPRFLHFCKVSETHQTSLRKTGGIDLFDETLIFFRLFPIFVRWFYQHAKGLSAATDNIRCKRNTHLQNDPLWISL